MKLTKEEIEHIAKLAYLDLPEEKKGLFKDQLTEILDFVEKLSSAKTENTLPLDSVVGIKNVFREDSVKPSLSQEEALKNSTSKHKGYFKVKAIFKK